MLKKDRTELKNKAIESLIAAALAHDSDEHILVELSADDRAALVRMDGSFITTLLARKRPIPLKGQDVSFAKKSDEKGLKPFQDAILISALVRTLSTPDHPLGRKRYQKFSYLILRKADYDVSRKYSKKAAGPYDYRMRYQGGENIAKKKGYVQSVQCGKYQGLIPADNIDGIDAYLPTYDFAESVDWATTLFRKRTNDELELLATVDYAAIELASLGKEVTVNEIRDLITDEPEWAPKLRRSVFSAPKIRHALAELREFFPGDY